jgi:hypothetical protein
MIGFNLPINFIDDLEALLKRTKAKLKRVSALESEYNRIRRSLTPEFEVMANKSNQGCYSTPHFPVFTLGEGKIVVLCQQRKKPHMG